MRCADGPCGRSKNFTTSTAGGGAEHWNPRVLGGRDYPRIRCICEFNATIVLFDCCRRNATRPKRQTGRVGFEKSSRAIAGERFRCRAAQKDCRFLSFAALTGRGALLRTQSREILGRNSAMRENDPVGASSGPDAISVWRNFDVAEFRRPPYQRV